MKYKVGDKIRYVRGFDVLTGKNQPEYDYLINSTGVVSALYYHPDYPITIELKGHSWASLNVCEQEIEFVNENANCKGIRV